MLVNLIKKSLQDLGCSTLIVFSKSSSQKEKKAEITHKDLNKHLAQAVEEKQITGKLSEVVVYRELQFQGFRHVVVVGLGLSQDLNHEKVRQSAASAIEALKSLKVSEAALHFDGLTTSTRDSSSYMKAFVEGLLLAIYSYDDLKSSKRDSKQDLTLHIVSQNAAEKSIKSAFEEGLILATSVNWSRTLGDTPGNLMTPTVFAERAQSEAKGTGIKVQIWDKARIKKEKMGGLLGVSMGSAQEPRFIIMEYKGAKASEKPLVFVGKGLTFDCGGISIKPSANMEEMKYDMCGGANVIGALLAIAKLKLKLNVTVLVSATENMPGPAATKPGDVHTARNGKTFEVNNTDAEGRLILADALSYATELKPKAILDAATLTGAMVMALGNIHTGYFTRNDQTSKQIEKAAQASGELVWRMPLTDYHVSDMKGTFADLSNISSGKGAGSATAAAFLEQFVGEGIPWAHFDIAGTGWAVGNRLNYCPKKGASGAMVRTFVEFAKAMA
ncbi:MAG: leucyl aminopeptidase [Bdellovibrionales bacterium]